MFFLLLRVRLLSLWNTVRHAAARHKVVTVGLSALGILLFGSIYAGFRFFLSLVPTTPGLHEMIYELFYFLFLFLLAGSVPFVASTLLHSADYHLLSAAPIRTTTVVAAKILDATVANSLQFSVIGLPAIFACAGALRLSLGVWLVLPLLVALFVLLPVLITSLLLLSSLSLFGAKRVRRAITIVNAVMAATVCLTIAAQTGRMQLHTGLRGGLESAARNSDPAIHEGPSAPFAAALLALGEGAIPAGLGRLSLIGAVIMLLFSVAVWWGGRVLTAANLSQEAEEDAGLRVPSDSSGSFRRGLLRLTRPPVAALVAKDLRYVMRDSVLLSQLGMPAILFFVPVILSLQQAGVRTIHSGGEVYPFAAAMTGIIVFMQTSIISLSSLGLEGRGFWQSLTSPNRGATLLWAKFLMSTSISAGIGVTLILVSALIFRAPLGQAALHASIIAVAAAGLCGLGVGISATFPRFVYENPAHRVSTWALILGFLGSVVYLMVIGVILLVGWSGLGLPEPRLVQIASALLFLLVTALAIVLPLTAGARRIDVYQWEH